MWGWASVVAIISCGLMASSEARECPSTHSYVGKTQDLDLVGRQLRGRVTVKTDCSFQVSMFELSDFGSQGDVYWYGATGTDTLTHVQETIVQAGFRLSSEPVQSPSNGTTLMVYLDEDITWDDVGTISAWELVSDDATNGIQGRNLGALLTADLIPEADVAARGSLAYGETLQGTLAATVLDNCVSLSSRVNLRWTINSEDQSVDFALESIQATNGWTGFGVAAPGVLSRVMGGSDVVIAGIGEPLEDGEDNSVFAVDSYITTYEECNYGAPQDELTGVCNDFQWSGGDAASDEVELIHAQQYDGITFVRYRRKWDTSDVNDMDLDGRVLDHVIYPDQDLLYIWATGGSAMNSFATESEEYPWFGPRIRYHGPEMGVNHGELHLTLQDHQFECPLLAGGSNSALSPCSSSFQFVDGFDERYSSSATLSGNKVRVFWQYNVESGDVRFGVRSLQSAKCVAIGFGKNMVGSRTFVGWTNERDGSNVFAYKMNSQKADGFDELLTTDEVGDATVFETALPGGGSALSFEFKLDGVDAREIFDIDLINSPRLDFIWSYGNSWSIDPKEKDLHVDRSSSSTSIDLSTGSASIDYGASAEFIWHGGLMWFVWCVVVPVILVAARYVRMLPKSSFIGTLWIKTHKNSAYLATLLALIATIITVVHIDDLGSLHMHSLHSKLGVSCMVFLGVQILLGIFRPPPNKKPAPPKMELSDISNGVAIGDVQALGQSTVPVPTVPHDFKWQVRVAWEYGHRLMAVVSFALAIASVFSGLDEIVLKGDSKEGSDRRYAITIAWLCIMGTVTLVLELTRHRLLVKMESETKLAMKRGAELLMKQLMAVCVVSLLGLFLWDRLAEAEGEEIADGCEVQALMFDDDIAPEITEDVTDDVDDTGTTPNVPPEYYTQQDDAVANEYPDCTAFPLRYVGDGWCDSQIPYNTAECGYDGGDCCDASNPLYTCKDPNSLLVGEAADTGVIPAPRNPRYHVGEREQSTEEVVTSYNNFYEFGYSKNIKAAAQAQSSFFEDPDWTIEISGLVENPMSIKVVDLINMMQLEERLYAHRCVEAWSIVQPVTGFPVTKLLDLVQPLESANYIRFQTFMDTDVSQIQNLDDRWPWPYTEGITMDEARNELAFLTVGLFGKKLPPQNGAPIRLQLPWKYGFKSVKSIKRIVFQEQRPATFWNDVNGFEYGFWANVNPAVSHPRWSQARERELIDSSFSYNYRPTEIYNGYETYVGYLYEGDELAGEALYMR